MCKGDRQHSDCCYKFSHLYLYSACSIKVHSVSLSRASCWNTKQCIPCRNMTQQTNLVCCMCVCVAVWKVMLQAVRWAPLWTPAAATVASQWPTVAGSAPATWTTSSTVTSYCPATHGHADPSSSTPSPSSASRQRRRPSSAPAHCQRAMNSHQTYRTSRWVGKDTQRQGLLYA